LSPPPLPPTDLFAVADATVEGFEPPQLNDVQLRVVESLRKDGIAVLPFQELLGEKLWLDAVAEIAPFVAESKETVRDGADPPAHKDDVIVRQFGVRSKKRSPPVETLSLESPWLRLAASELMLDIVNSYRRHWTRLYYVDNWFTVPHPTAPERIASQQWHRDPEDEHLVKVFVYFSDVDEGSGPFEYVCGSTTGSRYGDLCPWGKEGNYPPPGAVEAATAPEHRVALTGPAGTMIFCDTGGIHRGGFARTKPRVLSTCTYVGGRHKAGKHHFMVDFEGREEALPPRVRFALVA
jgi:hypothetical protein